MKAIANIFTLFLTGMYITTMHTNSQAIAANTNSSVPAVFVASTLAVAAQNLCPESPEKLVANSSNGSSNFMET